MIEPCWECQKTPVLKKKLSNHNTKYRYVCNTCPPRSSHSYRASQTEALVKWNQSSRMIKNRKEKERCQIS